MKRVFHALLAAALCLLCACADNTAVPQPTPSPTSAPAYYKDDVYPVYTADSNGILWRVQADGAFSTGQQVLWYIGGTRYALVRYLESEDTVITAGRVRREDGKVLCSLLETGEEGTETLAEDVLFDSVRFSPAGELLCLTRNNVLLRRRGNAMLEVASGVAEAEWCGEELLVYRSNVGAYTAGEFSYAVFTAAPYEDPVYIGQALYLAAADSKNGKVCLISRRHTVSKRSVCVTVGDCAFFSAGDGILFALQNVVLSQFDACDDTLMFLLTADIRASALLCDLYRVDESAAVLTDSSVLEGNYIASDGTVYAYEVLQENGQGVVRVTDYFNDKTQLPCNSGILARNTVFSAPYVYYLEDGTLMRITAGSGADPSALLKNATALFEAENGVLCFVKSEQKALLDVYYVTREETVLLTGAALFDTAEGFRFSDGTLYYYSYDETAGKTDYLNLSRANTAGARVCVWGVQKDAGFLLRGQTVFLVADTGSGRRLVTVNNDGSAVTLPVSAQVLIDGFYYEGG